MILSNQDEFYETCLLGIYLLACISHLLIPMLFPETCSNYSEVQIWWAAHIRKWHSARLRNGGWWHHWSLSAANRRHFPSPPPTFVTLLYSLVLLIKLFTLQPLLTMSYGKNLLVFLWKNDAQVRCFIVSGISACSGKAL